MKDILEKYSTRLVNISGRNGSLTIKRLFKKRSFDITRLDEFIDDISISIINLLLSRDTKEIKIIEDPYKWYKDKLKEVEKSEEYTEESFNEVNEKLKRKQEKLIGYSNSIKTLIKEIKSIEKETGRYELYIGYPFVEGYFKDKTFVKAPLFLFPIEIIKKGDVWILKNKVYKNILLNKVFLIGYAKFNEEKLVNIDTEYSDLSVFGENFIHGAINELSKFNINISFNEPNVTRFREVTKDTILNYNLGELTIKNNIIAGQFNIANSIYSDYKEMEDKNLSNDLINKLLKNIELDKQDVIDLDKEYEINEKNIHEKEFFFISDLDYSQEIAVKKSYENSELVIYGSPGTGKSQTIVNIISQYLANSKRVLMITQKKVALDVIFNRSGSINSKMIMFNKEINKKQFYASIKSRMESLEKSEVSLEEINIISNNIDKKINKLKLLESALTKKLDFGLTLQEMYSKAKVNIDKDSKIDLFFRSFRREYPFEGFKYKELVDISNNILSNKKAENFYKLKEIMRNNKYSLYLKENIDTYDLEDAKNDIDNLINSYEAIINEIDKDIKYFEVSKEIALGNKSIIDAVKEINNNENGELLKKLTNKSKLSLKYWLNLRKNKNKERENLELFNKKHEELKVIISNESSIIKEVLDKFKFLNDVLVSSEVDKIIDIFNNKEQVISSLKLIYEVLDKYDEIYSLKGIVNDINEKAMKVLEYVYSKEKDFKIASDIIKNIANLSMQVQISKAQHEYGKELEVIENFDTIRKEICQEMIKKREKVPMFINRIWDNNTIDNKSYNKAIWKEMYRQCTKKSKLLPIREFVDKFSKCIFELYPCWLLSPESVSEILPLTEGLFDVIIFDEASQMFIESAIPTIYRGKCVVVAGDDKQLKPSSDFLSKYNEEEEDEDIENLAALEEESLLDLAKHSFPSTYLYYHYRSQYDELINFSNYAFYGGKLEVSPNILNLSSNEVKPIERIKVNGKWIDRVNKEEAIEVVKLIKDILINRKENETIGVITFNISQRDLIDEMLEVEAGKDPVFSYLYLAENERKENNEDISLFIKNIENVQGDERDIIIFSTAYAKNEKGKMVNKFGSLLKDGGENRLNVDESKNNGSKLLKKYLQYVRAVSDGDKELMQKILNSVCDSEIGRNEIINYDSDFENEVHDALERKGLVVDTQIGVSGYKIDLGVYDKEASKYILGIECDGAAFHSSKSARERDIYRQRYLESRGWNIIRIWSKNWWNNQEREVDRIIERVNLNIAQK